DGDGLISKDEFPEDLWSFKRLDTSFPDIAKGFQFKNLFPRIDRNGDGKISKQEWDTFVVLSKKRLAAMRQPGLVAIRPGEKGEVAESSIQWREKRGMPEVASPLLYRERVYLVKDGGIVTCLEAKSGKVAYRERLGGAGTAFASPVAGDGKVYLSSRNGMGVVLAAGGKPERIAKYSRRTTWVNRLTPRRPSRTASSMSALTRRCTRSGSDVVADLVDRRLRCLNTGRHEYALRARTAVDDNRGNPPRPAGDIV